MMDLKQMEYILAVYDAGSVTGAAEQLDMTPQALGKTLRTLEEKLGAPLFERASRRLVPTHTGEVFAAEARQLLAGYDGMQGRVAAAVRHQKGQLRIAMSHGVMHALGDGLLRHFYKEHPEAEVELIELPDLLAEEYVRRGECELGFSIGKPLEGEGWVCHTVSRHKLCAVVLPGDELAGFSTIGVPQLAGRPVITKNYNFRAYHTLEACAARQGVALEYALRSPDEILWQNMVREENGVGIGISFLQKEGDSVMCIPFEEEEMNWNICLVYRRGQALGPAAGSFCRAALRFKREQEEGIL